MFLSTVGISVTTVKTAFDKLEYVSGVKLPDQRGRQQNHQKVEGRRELKVIEHIKVDESHYVGNTEVLQFLPKDLSISEMHSMYLTLSAADENSKKKFHFYTRVSRKMFRLKFQKLKKDECNKCTTYNSLPEKTAEQEKAHEQHLADKKIARRLKEGLKAEANSSKITVTAAFDLEQVLLCPFGAIGAFCYSRRLKNHNLNITEIDSMTTYYYLWNEHEENKGSGEIASAVFGLLARRQKKERKSFISSVIDAVVRIKTEWC